MFAIPSGGYLMLYLLNNSVFKNYKRFYLLYLFLVNNFIFGIVVLICLCLIFCFIHKKIHSKKKIKLDEELINHIKKENKYTNKSFNVL